MALPAEVRPLLKVGQAARVLGMSERTVKGWLERGTLPYVQPSGTRGARLIPARDVDDLATRCGIEPHWEEAI